MDQLVFDDIAPISEPVTIAGKSYMLREATEAAASRWRNYQIRSARMVDGKVSGVGDIADGAAMLVSYCLFEVTDKGERPVPLDTVRSWPTRVVQVLFERCKKISELEDRETREALKKRIEESQRKLDEMNGTEGEGDPAKNGLASTPAISA